MLITAMLETLTAFAVLAAAAPTGAKPERLAPLPVDWDNTAQSAIDLSGFLDAPAGRLGFIGVAGEHLVRPDGQRFRIWGVNLTSRECFPTHEQAVKIAEDLARLGINAVRFHHMDSGGIFDPQRNDTRQLSAESMDRLDFLIDQLRQRGIYSNLNLNVSRHYREGDAVRDYKLLGYGKGATYFNPRLVELQHEYARQLLTHRNRYTGREYRHEPCIVVVEMVNENSLVEAWVNNRLIGRDDPKATTWSAIPVSYAEELTDQYNAWLEKNVFAAALAAIRREAGSQRVPRLQQEQFRAASRQRFEAEASFYMAVERQFFTGMRRLLKDELGVRSLLVGDADHADTVSGYAHISANLVFDIVDGHGYWQHPKIGEVRSMQNTPMVNDPLDSTVTQFARTPVVGRPFTISEVNHPFPHEYAAEGFPILTAYALFHDWDGIYWFTWGKGRNAEPDDAINGHFDFSNDPVKVATMAACAPVWYRHDVAPARERIVRSYDRTHVVESLRMSRNQERPFFTPGFPRTAPLEHATRFTLDGSPATAVPPLAPLGRIASDTGEILWSRADTGQGVVTVDTPLTQAIVGYVAGISTSKLDSAVANDHCALLLTSLDGQPLDVSKQMLLLATSKTTNAGLEWLEDRKTIAAWGNGPVEVEPVVGRVTLKQIAGSRSLKATALSPVGKRLGPAPLAKSNEGWTLTLGELPASWYLLEQSR